MTLNYQSGEEVRKGDRVTYHGEQGDIEIVADPESPESVAETQWYIKEFGGGVLIREPKVFGLVFIPMAQIPDDEDLAFVARAAHPNERPAE